MGYLITSLANPASSNALAAFAYGYAKALFSLIIRNKRLLVRTMMMYRDVIWLLTIDCRLVEEVIRRLVLSGGEAGLVVETGGIGCGSFVVGLELCVDRQVIVPPDLALVLHGRAGPVLLLLSNVRVREYFSHGKTI